MQNTLNVNISVENIVKQCLDDYCWHYSLNIINRNNIMKHTYDINVVANRVVNKYP